MTSWWLVDDSPEEATSFAQNLSKEEALSIVYTSVKDAAAALDNGTLEAAGILMDVDLSNETGRKQTGPGLSQDIRVAQQKQTIPPFPIVRFSLRDKVLQNIGRDSSSDDLFDLKIEKDGLSAEEARTAAQAKLIGVRKIYDALQSRMTDVSLPGLVGLAPGDWQKWGSTAFQSDFESGDRVHLRAGPFIRMMVHPGLLIDEDVLGFRLGLNIKASTGWPTLKEKLTPYTYRGVAANCFPRWWARGIEEWWQDELAAESPLAGCTIGKRVEHLSRLAGELVPLTMPKGSMGDRPWRYCLLTKEQRQEAIPVDPSKSVKIRPRSPMPAWLDPLYAALGVALQNPDDSRLDNGDLRRLQLFTRTEQ
jgi:hypothetical protein